MKRIGHILCYFLLATALVACSEFDAGTLSEDFPDVPRKEYNDFDFSTTNEDFSLKLQYNLEHKAPIYFELYDKMPIGTMARATATTRWRDSCLSSQA